ncbi:hypothetical protein HO133_006545 [Letharia lupina]|uniref:Uncharacterized protein n=1 Tax=Letharia lupina TaxID=560253 RepID=A0A8H6C6J0_9LECA|nr:uncharacterized protein HO133_006545 [Letharia lupina]KAF6217718.1 hypothetical protein HO133_006545 [Letharia lupina]
MARTSRSRSPNARNTTLAIRTRDPLRQIDITTPDARKFISTQADRCPFPGYRNSSPHQHSTAKGKIAPSVETFREAGAAIRERWTQEQRRRIAENEAALRQLAEVEQKVGSLSIKTHLPRGNDLTVPEQIAIIHGGGTPAQRANVRGTLLERQRQNTVDNKSLIPPVSPARPGVSQNNDEFRTQTEQTHSIRYDDFPELDARYGSPPKAKASETLNLTIKSPPKSPAEASSDNGKSTGLARGITNEPLSRYRNTDFLNTNPQCTGPCPIQFPHNQGAYLQQGQIPRVWNARWGYSDPPRGIWEAWVRIEQGRGRSWDHVEVDGFAQSHRWAGP